MIKLFLLVISSCFKLIWNVIVYIFYCASKSYYLRSSISTTWLSICFNNPALFSLKSLFCWAVFLCCNSISVVFMLYWDSFIYNTFWASFSCLSSVLRTLDCSLSLAISSSAITFSLTIAVLAKFNLLILDSKNNLDLIYSSSLFSTKLSWPIIAFLSTWSFDLSFSIWSIWRFRVVICWRRSLSF